MKNRFLMKMSPSGISLKYALFPSISMKVMGIFTNLAIISPHFGKMGLGGGGRKLFLSPEILHSDFYSYW